MKFTWRTEWPALLVLALMAAIAAWSWPRVPERMPVHFGFDGRPDAWGGRVEGLLIVPAVAAGLYAVFLVLPRLDPGRANYPGFAGAYLTIRLLALGVLMAVQVAMVAAARGAAPDMNLLGAPLVGVALMVVGNLMGKIRPNWFVGFRTPWTLSSKQAWTRTHRAAGWVLIACGALFVIAGVLGRGWALAAATGVLLASTIALAAYSYRVWRADPDKVPPTGTSPGEEPR
jgi:uncharacterized membrane protein